MGLCYTLAETFGTAMIRLDHFDEIDPEGTQHSVERQQLQAFVDLCYALARVEADRKAGDKAGVVA